MYLGVLGTGILAATLTGTGLMRQGTPDAAQTTQATSPATFGMSGQGLQKRSKRGHVDARYPVPLTNLELAQQMLNRFTFGARPGDVERVASMGPDKWFEQQLNPGTIKDDAVDRRLRDFPTLGMTAEQALLHFPDRAMVERVAKGQTPYPADPLLASVYQVQVFKYNDDLAKNKVDAAGKKAFDQSDAEIAATKKTGQEEARRIAGDLFALVKEQRMQALIKLPVAERIAFTTYLQGEQKNLLFGDFTPLEREAFTAMAANINSSFQVGQELAQATMVRAILSERQIQEVMAEFWFNHFNVFIGKDSDQWYTSSYDRDAIRIHALGKFRNLLLATAKSPAMMVYLDNWLSIGPGSKVNAPAKPGGKGGNKGLNENYAREVMELHTVGVNGGYSQADVTALAAILTGWGVDRPGQGGAFLYDAKKHEPGVKQWFGHTIGGTETDASGGMQEGIDALTLLAASPKTAHFISWKLAQRFVADDPPAALVDRMAETYLSSDGDLRKVLRTLSTSAEFRSRKYFRNKVKTPVEFLASAFRTTGTEPANPGAVVNTAKQMGMEMFHALPPTGYYVTAEQWMNTGALVDRLNFAYQLTTGKYANQKFDAAHVLALALMASSTNLSPERMTSGVQVVLSVLEETLAGASVSANTRALIRNQIEFQPDLGTIERLNLLTALVMGSPEFQVR